MNFLKYLRLLYYLSLQQIIIYRNRKKLNPNDYGHRYRKKTKTVIGKRNRNRKLSTASDRNHKDSDRNFISVPVLGINKQLKNIINFKRKKRDSNIVISKARSFHGLLSYIPMFSEKFNRLNSEDIRILILQCYWQYK